MQKYYERHPHSGGNEHPPPEPPGIPDWEGHPLTLRLPVSEPGHAGRWWLLHLTCLRWDRCTRKLEVSLFWMGIQWCSLEIRVCDGFLEYVWLLVCIRIVSVKVELKLYGSCWYVDLMVKLRSCWDYSKNLSEEVFSWKIFVKF